MVIKKFYGVKVGRMTGIYKTWEECKKQVNGFNGATYKSFSDEQSAKDYVYGNINVNCVEKIHHNFSNYNIFVDGSFCKEKNQYSWAFVVFNETELIYQDSNVGDNPEAASMHNVAGELAATMRAIKWALEKNFKPIVIHHDYLGISAWATGKWKAKNKFTQAYINFVKSHLTWIKFNKVRGHSGNEGNELADKLAGEMISRL